MANFVQLWSEEGIQVLESGSCGEVEDLRVDYYTISGKQCVRAWQLVLNNTERTVIVMPENCNDGAVVSEHREAIESQLKSYQVYHSRPFLRHHFEMLQHLQNHNAH